MKTLPDNPNLDHLRRQATYEQVLHAALAETPTRE
jgi:hypothetical protein